MRLPANNIRRTSRRVPAAIQLASASGCQRRDGRQQATHVGQALIVDSTATVADATELAEGLLRTLSALSTLRRRDRQSGRNWRGDHGTAVHSVGIV
jgi:hypothetical protein